MKKLFFTFSTFLTICLGFVNAQNWYEISVPTNVKLNDIEFPSPSIGYIGGNDSTLLKTTDGGVTWNIIPYTGINASFTYHIVDLEFVSETVGYMICDWTSDFYKTIDGGLTWAPVTDIELGNICYKSSIYTFNENHLFLGGAGCFQPAIIKEYDAPNWTENYLSSTFQSPTDAFVSDMDFSANYAIASIANNRMLRSIDDGQSWDTIPTGLNSSAWLNEVLIVNDTLAYVAYSDTNLTFGLLRSNDMGQSWFQDGTNATFYYPNFLSLHQSDTGKIYTGAEYVFGEFGLILSSMDASNWWIDEVDQPIHAIDSYLQNVTFAVGDSGYVITNTPLAQLSTEEVDIISSTDIQIYPNPTSGSFTVKSTREGPLMIYNMAGRFIREGELNQEINLGNQPVGIYLVYVDNHVYKVAVNR